MNDATALRPTCAAIGVALLLLAAGNANADVCANASGFPSSSTSSGQSSVCGQFNDASGLWTSAMGNSNEATGSDSNAHGQGNDAIGSFNNAFGGWTRPAGTSPVRSGCATSPV